jgi:hypothetical protein
MQDNRLLVFFLCRIHAMLMELWLPDLSVYIMLHIFMSVRLKFHELQPSLVSVTVLIYC